MELEVTWKRALFVWWAYTWRFAAMMLFLSFLLLGGALALGPILAKLNLPEVTTEIVPKVISWLLGIFYPIVPLKLILNGNYGDFRLALVKKEGNEI